MIMYINAIPAMIAIHFRISFSEKAFLFIFYSLF